MIIRTTDTVNSSFSIRPPFKYILRKSVYLLSYKLLEHFSGFGREIRVDTIVTGTIQHNAVESIIPDYFLDNVYFVFLHFL